MIAPLRPLLAVSAIALAAAASLFAVSPGTAQKAAAPADWSNRVSQSQVGGHVLGNPAATQKIVEYMSYTCPHCAAFDQESDPALADGFIAKGKTSLEVRNFIRDPLDMTVALLARCGEPRSFFRRHHGLLASQRTWMTKAGSLGRDGQAAWYQGDINARLKRIASDLGLYDELRRHSPLATNAQIDACLANKAEQGKVLAMTKFASETVKIEGTPSFTINGKLQANVYDWKSLEPLLASR
ncbi:MULTISPECIES: thioredoxin domain-containing protein [Pseudomonadota]|jgi:protein-disulfide isomerase|uniref:thioredoxin domain-containing protein n=1 Tax=Pseudomonadota TaxID=1224 RepID=UPI000769F327|nr:MULTISPECIES: thioredoxin domain-containing protein [Pseudomonadota]MAF60864.1 protein-disulfide isomerase [Blastomonas sp.]|tara:strand:- start:296414 stop:297136 length:723 start_codon:yes stop_codon:yes gene_type:complete